MITRLLLISFLCCFSPAKARPKSQDGHLTVFIVFDQMRLKELKKYKALFGKGGFGGLMEENTFYSDVEYAYFSTETGPGHATISTGVYPDTHGIPANSWPQTTRNEYVVEDSSVKILYRSSQKNEGRSPKNLHAESLSDHIKNQSALNRVYSLAIKDRAAILLGGHQPDLALWYDKKLGAFTSSSYYTKELPSWLKTLAFQLPKKSMAQGLWKTPQIDLKFKSLIPMDNRKGESEYYSWTKNFPHNLKDVPKNKHKRSLYRASPQAVNDLFTIAKTTIQKEHLGHQFGSDILYIGISVTDYIGHSYGPDSLEYLSILLKADKEIRKLVSFLKENYHQDAVTLCLTADHGAPDLPDHNEGPVLQGRIHARELQKELNTLMLQVSSKESKVLLRPPHVYFVLTAEDQKKRQLIVKTIQKHLLKNRHIKYVYNIHQNNNVAKLNKYFKHTLYTPRSGDLIISPQENFVFDWGSNSGIDHGSINSYDRFVPLYIMDSKVRNGAYFTDLEVVDIKEMLIELIY